MTYTCYRSSGRVSHYHGIERTTYSGPGGRSIGCHHEHTTQRAAYRCTDRVKEALDHMGLVVLATFGSDYYVGQWSRLYRLQCRARALIARRYCYADGTANIPARYIASARRTKLYRELVSKYAKD